MAAVARHILSIVEGTETSNVITCGDARWVLYTRGKGPQRELRRARCRSVEDFDQAIKLNPNLAIAYYNRGKATASKANMTAPSRTSTRPSGSTRATPTTSTSAASPRPKRATRKAKLPTSRRRGASIPTSGGRRGAAGTG